MRSTDKKPNNQFPTQEDPSITNPLCLESTRRRFVGPAPSRPDATGPFPHCVISWDGELSIVGCLAETADPASRAARN